MGVKIGKSRGVPGGQRLVSPELNFAAVCFGWQAMGSILLLFATVGEPPARFCCYLPWLASPQLNFAAIYNGWRGPGSILLLFTTICVLPEIGFIFGPPPLVPK